MEMTVSKIHAASEQIDAAINLLAENKFPVSVHTLSAAAYEVAEDLCKHGKVFSIGDAFIIHLKDSALKGFLRGLAAPANFFKHADRDPNEVIFFNTEKNDLMIFMATMNLAEIQQTTSLTRRVFLNWFAMKKPEAFEADIWEAFSDPHGAKLLSQWAQNAPREAMLAFLRAMLLAANGNNEECTALSFRLHEEYGLPLKE
ncbi:hypothetical protein [Azospirillum thiophilum]|uniref:hypothetical protein n=1 Tax=Azospirillum thiophilum TaxID=528244 RepID=UPI00118749CA|nr:hypothetical protein [Azospirillum thiophilum]